MMHPRELAEQLIRDHRLPQLNTVSLDDLEQAMWEYAIAGWTVRDVVGAVNEGVRLTTERTYSYEVPFRPPKPLRWLADMFKACGAEPMTPFMQVQDSYKLQQAELIRRRMRMGRNEARPVPSEQGLAARDYVRELARNARLKGRAKLAAADRAAAEKIQREHVARMEARKREMSRLTEWMQDEHHEGST